MINTKSHLAFVLKFHEKEIDSIISKIDEYYYEKIELKFNKDGTPDIKNGHQKKRTLHPSIKRLKTIQQRIQKNILSKLSMP